MTLELVDIRPNDAQIVAFEQHPRPLSRLRLKVQFGLMLFIGCACLATGLRLLSLPDPLATMAGLGLLIPIPSCCYFAWRDIQVLKEDVVAFPGGR